MLFWFFGTAIAAVWFVFRDPRFDYRLLCVGAILPDLVDIGFGGARALHSITVSIAVLMAIVIASAGRRRWRKRALAVPIGMMLHLVFDGAFGNTRVFWWPFSGLSFPDQELFSIERGWIDIPLELIGVALLWWAVQTFGLTQPSRRREFLRTGELHPVTAASAARRGRAAPRPRRR